MWLANLEKLEMLHRVDYGGEKAWLVPIQRMTYGVRTGENLIAGLQGHGIIGYGKILSEPLRLSTISKERRQYVTGRQSALRHVFISLDTFSNVGALLPYSILDYLPGYKRVKQRPIIGRKYFYRIWNYAYWALEYLINGELYDDIIRDCDYEATLTKRLHHLYDIGKSWYLWEVIHDKNKKREAVGCRYCNTRYDDNPGSFFQVHYGGSMTLGAKYLKSDCVILCPNCHAIEDLLVIKKNELFTRQA